MVDYEPRNILFIKWHALKFVDLVDFYMAQAMYKVYNLLPNCIQMLFEN